MKEQYMDNIRENYSINSSNMELDMLQQETTKTFSNCSISQDSVNKMSDSASVNTSSSFETDFESIFHDYSKVINALSSEQFRRSTKDLENLSQFLQTIPEFLQLTINQLELVCQAAKLLVCPCKHQFLIKKFSNVRKWIFCLEGTMCKEDDEFTILTIGQYLGTDLSSMEIVISNYDLYTNTDNTKLFIVDLDDFSELSSLHNNKIIKKDSYDNTIAEYESTCKINDITHIQQIDGMEYVLVKASTDVLIQHLIYNQSWTHCNFIEDLCLCMPLCIPSSKLNYLALLDKISLLLLDESQINGFDTTVELLLKLICEMWPVLERCSDCVTSCLHICEILREKHYYDHLRTVRQMCSASSKTRIYTISPMDMTQFLTEYQIKSVKSHSLFYIDSRINDSRTNNFCVPELRPGDLLVMLDGEYQLNITRDLIKSIKLEHEQSVTRNIELGVRSDLLGYHDLVLSDIPQSEDTYSINSTPTRHSRCFSEKNADSYSLSTNSSNNSSNDGIITHQQRPSDPYSVDELEMPVNKSIVRGHFSTIKESGSLSTCTTTTTFAPESKHQSNCQTIKKRPSLLPNILVNLQITSAVGKYFKKPKTYSKSNMPNSHFMDLEPFKRLESTINFNRMSMRLKSKRRKSAGSNPDLSLKFQEDEQNDNNSFYMTRVRRGEKTRKSIFSNILFDEKYPLRIYWKPEFLGKDFDTNFHQVMLGSNTNSTNNSANATYTNLRQIHVQISRTASVIEIIILALLKLDLTSATSSQFFLVEVSIDERNNMRYEKIMKPTDQNLIKRISSGCKRFYLKHQTYIGHNLISQPESDRMLIEYCHTSCLDISPQQLVIQMFLHSHNLLAQLTSHDILMYICKKTTDQSYLFSRYSQLSNFYKSWTIWEICSRPDLSPGKRSVYIQYFIYLAVYALGIGHIDLFFNVICALDSPEISRLTQTWDKVSSKDKKLLSNLRSNLDVTGNLRQLRQLHREMATPYLPMTAMIVKDVVVVDETSPNNNSSTINNNNINGCVLVSVEKLQRLSRIVRQIVNPICNCSGSLAQNIHFTLTSTVVSTSAAADSVGRIHSNGCYGRLDNKHLLRKLLYTRINKMYPTQSSNTLVMPNTDSFKSFRRKNSNFTSSSTNNLLNNSNSQSHSALQKPLYRPKSVYSSLESMNTTVAANGNASAPHPGESDGLSSSELSLVSLSQAFDMLQSEYKAQRYFIEISNNHAVLDTDYLRQLSLRCEPAIDNPRFPSKSKLSIKKTDDINLPIMALPNGGENISIKAQEILGLKMITSDNSPTMQSNSESPHENISISD